MLISRVDGQWVNLPTLVVVSTEDTTSDVKLPAPDISAVVAAFLRQVRENNGWSQDDFALRLRTNGLNWSRSVLDYVEKGSRKVDAGELLLLPRAISLALGNEVSLVDIFANETAVLLMPGYIVRPKDIPSLVGKRPSKADVMKLTFTDEERNELGEYVDYIDALREQLFEATSISEVAAMEETAKGDAERSAGRKFEVKPIAVAMASHHLWGRSLTTERDARMAALSATETEARTRQAQRGHVTRTLLDELRPVIESLPPYGAK